MKKLSIFILLLFALPAFAQHECDNIPANVLQTAVDANGVVHQIECWTPQLQQTIFPSGVLGAIASGLAINGAVISAPGYPTPNKLVTFAPNGGSGPQYTYSWWGANEASPSNTNYSIVVDSTDQGVGAGFADLFLNSTGGNVNLQNLGTTALQCGQRVNISAAKPSCFITNELQVPTIISNGTLFGISGCSNTSPAGGGSTGDFSSGTTGTCTVVITPTVAGTVTIHGWACHANDLTTNADSATWSQTATTATTATLSGTTVSGDIINFSCIGY